MGKVFGTDGIRGKANTYPMTPEMALRVGKAVALYFQKKNSREKHRIVIGKDTRLSGYMLETALTSGIVSMGVDTFLVGPMPTPAISHLTKSMNCDAGIVISASHNPSEDNGIKIFDTQGFKLDEKAEAEIEAMVLSEELNSSASPHSIGKAYRIDDAKGRYIEFAKNSAGNIPLSGLKVVLDCANGAAYHIAPDVFSELGAETTVLNDKPDGYNINKDCGALHPEVIQEAVKKQKADIGIALDGDADRVIVCDEKGNIVDGDAIMAIFASDLLKKGKLASKTIVATVMSNIGLEKAMGKLGIKIIRAQVGDKYVIDELRKGNFELGGEQSGHIIFREYSSTGDGIVCALQVARIIKETGRPLSSLAAIMEKFPQILVNIEVKEKRPFEKMPAVKKAMEEAETELGKNGRILVRYSGTENKARVMVEAKDKKTVERIAEKIASEIRREVGK
ncbi:MAG: phosphoglucosamine mutase [Candidatus Diapherotrites archaeon]|nr:phosphoglucosamine mutase [Candidatus Diapherotrites archaeon]